MGAQTFKSRATGKTAEEAFRNAREQAAWEYGHRGYTGTIAEKHGFVMATGRTPGETAAAYLERLRADQWARDIFPPGPEGETWQERDKRIDAVAPTLGDRSLDRDQRAYDDKWGPALCVKGDQPDEWVFCGWASV